jgi:hypothetical protein
MVCSVMLRGPPHKSMVDFLNTCVPVSTRWHFVYHLNCLYAQSWRLAVFNAPNWIGFFPPPPKCLKTGTEPLFETSFSYSILCIAVCFGDRFGRRLQAHFFQNMTAHEDSLHHGCSTFLNKGPRLLLWAGSRAPHWKIRVSGIPNCLNYCEIL